MAVRYLVHRSSLFDSINGLFSESLMAMESIRRIERIVDTIMLCSESRSDREYKDNSNTATAALYKLYFRSPEISAVKTMFNEIFNNESTLHYRISINLTGHDVLVAIANSILLGYLDVIKGCVILDRYGRPDQNAVSIRSIMDRYDSERKIWFDSINIEETPIYIAWKRPEELVIDVILSRDKKSTETASSLLVQ